MINKKVREYIASECECATLFSNPAYDNSIIGLDDKNRVIYDYDKMIDELCADEGLSICDAIDYCEYNTLGSLVSIQEDIRPIIVFHNENIRRIIDDSVSTECMGD